MKAICSEWQERLRLQDWHVYLGITRERDFENNGKEAEITIYYLMKQATINLVDPVDFPSTCVEPQDMEVSIVHELLHIYFGASHGDPDNMDNVAEEQAIHCISHALVNAKRGSNESKEDAEANESGKRGKTA